MKENILKTCFFFLGTGVLFALLRLIRGPKLMDRVLAMDAIAISFIAALGLLSIVWQTSHYIDLILIFSLLSFVTTLAYVAYLEKAKLSQDDEKET